MYLTRMELDTTKRKTMMAFASPAIFHGAIEHAFLEKGGKLWRVDSLSEKKYLLVVSELKPDFTDVQIQFGTDSGWKTLDYDLFLSNIKAGDLRRFRLKANPVVAKNVGSGSRGIVLAHVTPEQQILWLSERAEKNGFCFDPESVAVVHTAWESFIKKSDGRKHVTFKTATFEGVLTVSDADLFRRALQYGIGREKAYGCGLITVTRNCNE